LSLGSGGIESANKFKAKGVVLGRPERDRNAGERIAALRAGGMSLRQIGEREGGLSAAGVLKIIRRRAHRARPKETPA